MRRLRFWNSLRTTIVRPGLRLAPAQRILFLPTIIAVTPGDTLQLIVTSTTACYEQGSTCINQPLGGVFDVSNTDLLASNNQNRLPNQVSVSGLPNIQDPNLNTYYDANGIFDGVHLNTQIPDDFYICGNVAMVDCTGTNGTTVVVPTGANYLYVGALDSFYADNSGTITLTVDDTLSPEPATWTLMLGGLGVTAAYYRRRKALANR